MSTVPGAVLVVGAVVTGLGLPLVYGHLSGRVGWLPGDGWGHVIGLSAATALAGGVGLFVSGTPPVRVATPTGAELVVCLLSVVGVFLLAIGFGHPFTLLRRAFSLEPPRFPLDHFPGKTAGGRARPDTPAPVTALAFVVLAGVGEQFLFWGVIRPAVTAQFGTGLGVGVAGLATGLYYHPAVTDRLRTLDRESLRRLTLTGLGGAILGGTYAVTGNFVVPVVGHWLYLAALLAVRQGSTGAER